MICRLTLFVLISASSGALSVAHVDATTGRANVIDGDTIEIRGERIRLFGVDAPESAQTCRDAAGAAYRCGQRAALALADRISVQTVSCKALDRDRFGRTVSECGVGGENINAWLVRNGWAVAYRRYGGGRYDAEERAAKAAKAGIWAGAFVMPEAYRRTGRTPASGNRMNCTQLRAAGLAPVRRGSPHYHTGIDGDRDGVGCE